MSRSSSKIDLRRISSRFSSLRVSPWPYMAYCSSHFSFFPYLIPCILHLMRNQCIVIDLLPPGVSTSNLSSISEFLAKPWIWEQLAPAERVLLFSKDSVLCEKSRKNVDDFADVDVISSKESGLSLRNRRMLLEITRQASFTGLTINEAGEEVKELEHQWLESILRGPAIGSVWNSSVKLPSDEDEIDFVGKEWSDGRPLGFAMPEIWNDEDVKPFEE